ncbi:uncharacterized protein LOC123433655 [Hordeum vulgare subsp. vulgare]|uniref:DUF1618 domain-containing protein n=1 Tax=Hordeum vulgare subsp. vulgare TaxID=112509 RepID=A0A8I6WSP2_HORVV|nr:uncharacterized protein LOC123433655 [Hordeum vulgare subsp. vulgare]
MALPTLPFNPPTPPPPGFPDSAILCKTARVSADRNATTAGCRTEDGQAVEVSFWLVHPPGISHFSVNCPGINREYEAWLVCAEDAFVLFSLQYWGPARFFVYTAGKHPSLRLLPNPSLPYFGGQQFGLLPRGDGEHYALAFLRCKWSLQDDVCRFDAHVFSSETRAWTTRRAYLSDPADKPLCGRNDLFNQIRVGATSLGWFDNHHGILLLDHLFATHPVISIIPLPVATVGLPMPIKPDDKYIASEYFYNVACCHDLIKFVHIKYDDPHALARGSGWKATMWNMNVSGKNWCKGYTVDVDEISVDKSFSAKLPELWDDETQQLQLKKLMFHGPILSTLNDDLLYMMAKVKHDDDTAWTIAIDMKHAALKALAKFSVGPNQQLLTTACFSCVFPKYLNIPPGAEMYDPLEMHFKRMSLVQFVMQVQRTREWFRELDLFLDCDLPTYKESKPLLTECCPVSSLCVHIRALLKYATCTDEASNNMQHLLRAFEGFDMLLTESFNEQASDETLRSKIIVALPILDNLLHSMLPTVVPEGRCQGGVGIFEQYEKSGYTKKGHQSCGSTADKVCYSKKRNRAKKRTHKQQQEISKPNYFGGNVALNRWWYLGGYMLMSIGMLALCWMILTTLEVWTEPATSNLTLRSFGTKLSVIYKYYTDTWSEDGRSCRRC